MKVVINRQYGGFSVSEAAMRHMGLLVEEDREEYRRDWYFLSNEDFDIESGDEKAYRADPRLVKAVEELGRKADGECATLKVVEIPDGVEFYIEEYNGLEWAAEKHRTWK